MLRSTLRQCRPLLKVTKSSQTLFGNNTQQKFVATPQCRSVATDLSLGIQFSVPTNKLKATIKRAEELGAKLVQKKSVVEVYYDAVPEGEELADSEVVTSHFDIKSKKDDPEKGRAQIHPRIGRPKLNHAGLYTLTKRDMWLCRADGGQWTLRLPAEDETGRTHLDVDTQNRVPVFRVANGEREIRRELSLQQDETIAARTGIPLPTLEEDLETRMNVVPFASFVNTYYKFHVPSQVPENINDGLVDDETEAKQTKAMVEEFGEDAHASADMVHPIDVEDRADDIILEITHANFGYAYGQALSLVENPDEDSCDEQLTRMAHMLDALEVELVNRCNTPILEYLERNRTSSHHKLLIGASVATRHYEKSNRKDKKEGGEEEKAEE